MNVLFVRHAEAVDPEEFSGDDLLRPLTTRGAKDATKAFAALATRYPKPDLILSSEAVRARQTADILAKAFTIKKVAVTPLLNPGCKTSELKRLVDELPDGVQRIALVGHEPDFSGLISRVVADGRLFIKVKKGACIEVEMDEKCRGILRFAAPPELLSGK